jgi:two-component response regulator (ARR-B family)
MNARDSRIMIVDDDQFALSALNRLVISWGYATIPFHSFQDARAFLADQTPSALIVDIRLGMYNGLQLIHLAKQADMTMPVIAVSGFDDADLRAEAARAGAAYLLKPLELSQLREFLAASHPLDAS